MQKTELSLIEAKRNLAKLEVENARLQDTDKYLKEDLERAKATIASLREEVKNQEQEYSKELVHLKQSMSVENNRHAVERNDLQEQLNKVGSNN